MSGPVPLSVPARVTARLPRSVARRREAIEGYVAITPWLIGFFALVLGPLLASAYLSLTTYEIVRPPVFSGLDNYRQMAADRLFWQALKVTATYVAASVPMGMVLAFAVALLMNQKVMFLGLFRTIYYMPNLVPIVASSILWLWMFSPDFGLFNYLLTQLGVHDPPLWLSSTRWALPALVIMSLWNVGAPMLIYLAGLQGIPTELYEAAQIDGANAVNRFRHITLPQMTSVLFFNLIMGIIASWQAFAPAYIMTRGGPRYATLFYVLHLYFNAFQYFRMGYASALAWRPSS